MYTHIIYTYTHIHTHTYIYIYIYIYMRSFLWRSCPRSWSIRRASAPVRRPRLRRLVDSRSDASTWLGGPSGIIFQN